MDELTNVTDLKLNFESATVEHDLNGLRKTFLYLFDCAHDEIIAHSKYIAKE